MVQMDEDYTHYTSAVQQTNSAWCREKLQTSYTLHKTSPPGRSRTVVANPNIERLKKKLDLSPRRSVRSLSRQLKISTTSTWRILREELKKYPYRIQLKEKLTPQNKESRVHFANRISDRIEADSSFLQNILFTDEAHFHLSGHVNRQNMRIWGDENPHEAVNAPRSREKVTVFVGLGCDTGLVGPYFFEGANGKTETVKTENYLKMLRQKVVPVLKRRGTYESCVYQQDGAPPHCSGEAMQWLKETFGEDSLISRNSGFNWPPYSPDLNPLDFYLWGYLKSRVYSNPYPSTVEDLKKILSGSVKR